MVAAEAPRAEPGTSYGFDLAKGTIRFTPDLPVPDDVVVDLVRHRLQEIDGAAT